MTSRTVLALQKADMNNTYLSPVHALGWMYDDFSYEEGMEMCYDLLSTCDKLLVTSEPSRGVMLEIAMAEKLHMPVEFLTRRIYNKYLSIKEKEE